MARDSAATRVRILDAAIAEFAAYGLAGGRVERIAAASGANPKSIYVYFRSKELLFSAALHQVISTLTTEVPVTEHDLPGYAGRLFDYVLAHPEALRLSMWRQLERPSSGPEMAAVYSAKLQAMSGPAGSAGLSGTDLLVLVQGMAGSWFVSPGDLLAADGSDPSSPQRLAAHRAALVEAVRRLVGAADPGSPAPAAG